VKYTGHWLRFGQRLSWCNPDRLTALSAPHSPLFFSGVIQARPMPTYSKRRICFRGATHLRAVNGRPACGRT